MYIYVSTLRWDPIGLTLKGRTNSQLFKKPVAKPAFQKPAYPVKPGFKKKKKPVYPKKPIFTKKRKGTAKAYSIVYVMKTIAPLEASKIYFLPFWEILTDRPTNQPSIQPTNRYEGKWRSSNVLPKLIA